MDRLKELILKNKELIIELRREFHKHPELGFDEFKTSGRVAQLLKNAGIAVQTNVNKTGVVALLEGKTPGKTLILRADMDALAVQEEKDVPYASQRQGIMHACGHDGHTAVLAVLALILNDLRDQIKGSIKFVFQPSEEVNPGGALGMIEEGILSNPKVDAAIAFHLWNDRYVGEIGLREGPLMACVDEIEIDIKGKGGHGAAPHQCVDAIVVASHVITELQTIPSRQINPMEPVIITIGTIEGGSANNVIAHQVKMMGTVRSFDKRIRKELKSKIERVVFHVTASFGAEYVLRYTEGYPPTVCDKNMVELVRRVAGEIIGTENVFTAEKTLGGEDMSYLLEKVPGILFFVGSRNDQKGINYPHHHPKFDIDEDALPIALEIMARSALEYLNSN